MAAIKSKNTRPELALRKILSKAGLRYRLHVSRLPGCPDMVLHRYKIVIFCDGDFWHGRNWDRKTMAPKFGVRRKYWVTKIERNIARDKACNRELRKQGWHVIRIWESDIKKNPEAVIVKVLKAIKGRSEDNSR